MWLLAKAYNVRPSALAGIVDTVEAFSFDRAVWYFASCLENDMEEAGHEVEARHRKEPDKITPHIVMARQRVFDRYMNMEDGETTTVPKGRFADPMAKLTRPKSP